MKAVKYSMRDKESLQDSTFVNTKGVKSDDEILKGGLKMIATNLRPDSVLQRRCLLRCSKCSYLLRIGIKSFK